MTDSSSRISLASIVAFTALLIGSFSTGCGSETAPGSGAEIYTRYCATCHQGDGNGIENAFPPIRETEWANGDKGRLIRLVLYGMQGPIEVKGVTYNNVMTPHGFLTDDQVAAVLTYVRSNFGNDAEEVFADEVARVRAAEGERDLYRSERLIYRIGVPPASSVGTTATDSTAAE